jgi:hypothetical protein
LSHISHPFSLGYLLDRASCPGQPETLLHSWDCCCGPLCLAYLLRCGHHFFPWLACNWDPPDLQP